jgi:ribosomal protein L11 methyltransferase
VKWAEVSIRTTHEATEFIAEIFHDLGASGVVIEDPKLVNTYRSSGIWDYTDIPEAVNTEVVTVKAYLPADEGLEDKLRAFEREVDSLAGQNVDKGLGDIACAEIQDEDWSETWKAYYHPEKIGERIVVKPSWETYTAGKDELIIELDPGMAFGTGTHPTTSMCVRALEDIVRPGMRIFDVGTGSGVLAIAAAKLGASEVCAVDFDPLAVRIAGENVAINQVEHIVCTGQSDLLQNTEGRADLIIANIVADIIIRLLDDVSKKLNSGGTLLASGIINDRIADVTAAVMAHGFTIDKVIEEGGWAAMVIHQGGSEA